MNRQGFTLIEVLIVIAIIGILMAIGMVNYTRWRASSAVMQGAQQFAQAVNTTRTGAKRANACWQIRLAGVTTGATQYEVKKFSTSDCTSTATSTQTYTLPQGTSISISNNADNNVNFSPPYGTTDSSPNSYTVQWVSNTSIYRDVRITSILGKVVVK